MDRPEKTCDLVMKGGITSGVVYPMAVAELAKDYRFENIGGTSAGAIAAVVTAAAEYGRDQGGFSKVARLKDDLAKTLKDKFQPTPDLAGLFGLLIAALEGGAARALIAVLRHYPGPALGGLLPGLVIAVFGGRQGAGVGVVLLGLLIALIGAVAAVALTIWRQVTHGLPRADFGLCPGLTQKGAARPALTDWLADTLDDVAGLGPGDGPLTVGMLRERGINVQTVTTDITTHRPYALPMDNNLHFFSVAEFRRLFPARVVDHMLRHTQPAPEPWQNARRDLHYFQSEELPVVVLARMSLSFPLLISAVPLHRVDYTLYRPDGSAGVCTRCLFSDGGISSNFPVHFFDDFLPQTPTFGISLAELDPRRVKPGAGGDGRVVLPHRATQGQLLPTHPIAGLSGFVMALFDSAKDWQDSLQSILPGYRERIVTVSLKPDEGGLNLTMPPETITLLSEFGARAGREIVETFDLNEHRWRRYLVELRALDRMLQDFATSWDDPTPEPGALPYPDLATGHKGHSYGDLSAQDRRMLRDRAEQIAALGRALAAAQPLETLDQKLPTSRSRLRNVARMGD